MRIQTTIIDELVQTDKESWWCGQTHTWSLLIMFWCIVATYSKEFCLYLLAFQVQCDHAEGKLSPLLQCITSRRLKSTPMSTQNKLYFRTKASSHIAIISWPDLFLSLFLLFSFTYYYNSLQQLKNSKCSTSRWCSHTMNFWYITTITWKRVGIQQAFFTTIS